MSLFHRKNPTDVFVPHDSARPKRGQPGTAYEPTSEARNGAALYALAVLTVLALMIGTFVIASSIANNSDTADDALRAARAADRAVAAAAKIDRRQDRAGAQRRLDFARTDYHACKVDEAQDAVLATLLQLSLDIPPRRHSTRAQLRVRARFQEIATDLSKGRNCARIPALQALSRRQRLGIVNPGARAH